VARPRTWQKRGTMSDEPTLRRAVLDDPDSDGPRLTYADWCAQQADPVTRAHAELIRRQIELRNTPPHVVGRGGANSLVTRIAGLLAAHGESWAAPVRPFVDTFAFYRGFVELVRLSAARFLAHGAELFEAAPVRHVDLHGLRDVDEHLFESPSFSRLRSLGLDSSGLHDIHLQLLAHSPEVRGLRWLSATKNHFQSNGYAAIAASPHTRSLAYADFIGNPVDPVEQLGIDSGVVVAVEMPAAGQALEQRFGRLEWLHREDKSSSRFDY
jgi:uncharacterized protein (TIGR02996 family)